MAFSLKAALSPTRSKVQELQTRIQALETRNAELRSLIQSETALEAEQLHDLEELQADLSSQQQHTQSLFQHKQALIAELAKATADLQAAIQAVHTEESSGNQDLLVARHREITEKMVLNRLSSAHIADIAVLQERFSSVSKRVIALRQELEATKAAKRPLLRWITMTLSGIQQEALRELQSLAKEIS